MTNASKTNIVIVGGGTAGWITAAMLGRYLGQVANICLIESDKIGTVGVGEATIPSIVSLNNLLGLNEAEMMKACGATMKLGIQFENWGNIGEQYMHAFGYAGVDLNALQFYHYWLKSLSEGLEPDFWGFSPNYQAAKAHKFDHVPPNKNGLSGLLYAYHFDAGLYAQHLRHVAESLGVKRIEGTIVDVQLSPEAGDIESVVLEDEKEITGDLFVDCSGFRGLLIGKALGVNYQDWSHWLPCNSAIAVASERAEPLLPYTKAIAHDAGWQWRIPLQHRLGNGHVYCDQYMSSNEAERILRDNLDSKMIGEPKHLSFKTGRREKFWYKNCVAIGLSSGFMEPLESTSIHLIQNHAAKLVDLFSSSSDWDVNAFEYNRQAIIEYDLIRDFLILHYKQTRRDDSEFWRYCRQMEIPDTLSEKLALFTQVAKLRRDPQDLFDESSWFQVMIGQGLIPKSFHPRAASVTKESREQIFGQIKTSIANDISNMPGHAEFLRRYCPIDETIE